MKITLSKLLLISLVILGHFITGSAQIHNETSGDGSGVNIISGGNYNTLYGDSTGFSLTTQDGTTMIGFAAGRNNITSENTFIGAYAGYFNTTGFDNLFIGKDAGRLNTTAGDNTFIGTEAGENNTTGNDNTFVGEEAGTNNIYGDENTFVGQAAGINNVSGYRNTYLGTNAGAGSGNSSGYANTGVGFQALEQITTGHHNTVMGGFNSHRLRSGNWNTIVGGLDPNFPNYDSGTRYASYNTFIGVSAGGANNRSNGTTNANRNTYVGYGAGFTNRDGEDNVGMGAIADFNATNINRSVFLGAEAVPSENDVIMMGYQTFSDGAFSINIGQYGDVRSEGAIGVGNQVNIPASANHAIALGNGTGTSASNAIAIGYQVQNTVANSAVIGNDAVTHIGGPVNWTATSDGRLKTDIQENVIGLELISRLEPVTYAIASERIFKHRGTGIPEGLASALDEKSKIRYSGFIAQDVEKLIGMVGYEGNIVKRPENDRDIYGLRYAELVVPLVKATQELNNRIELQKLAIDENAVTMAEYEQQVTALMAEMEALSQQNEQMRRKIEATRPVEHKTRAGKGQKVNLYGENAKTGENEK